MIDQSEMLRRVSGKDEAFNLPAGRGDEARSSGHGPDPREKVPIKKARDIYVPDLHIDTLTLKARNFR